MPQMLKFMPGLYGNLGVDVNEKYPTTAANGVQTENDQELPGVNAIAMHVAGQSNYGSGSRQGFRVFDAMGASRNV